MFVSNRNNARDILHPREKQKKIISILAEFFRNYFYGGENVFYNKIKT